MKHSISYWPYCCDMQTGQTPLHKAVQYGILECAKILIDAGAAFEASDKVRIPCMTN